MTISAADRARPLTATAPAAPDPAASRGVPVPSPSAARAASAPAPTAAHTDPAVLARLLQLASPALPVGGFSYSQGLEWAVEAGWLHDAASVCHWLHGLLHGPVGRAEAAWVARMLLAWRGPAGTTAPAGTAARPAEAARADDAALARLDALFQASREGAQLVAETRQMGWSLVRLLEALPPGLAGPGLHSRLPVMQRLAAAGPVSYPLAWTCLAASMEITEQDALQVWLWSWLENQVMAAIKTVPLGQNAGQVMLLELGRELAPLAARAVAAARAAVAATGTAGVGTTGVGATAGVGGAATPGAPGAWADEVPDPDGPGNFAPGFALAVTGHETQYSRLFRS